jgi:hypothetical protein
MATDAKAQQHEESEFHGSESVRSFLLSADDTAPLMRRPRAMASCPHRRRIVAVDDRPALALVAVVVLIGVREKRLPEMQ